MNPNEQNDHKIRFSDYFGTSGSRILSVLFGLLAGGASALFLGFLIGVLIGAIVTLLTSFILPYLLYRADIPYEALKNAIVAPFIFDERVRFTVRGGRSVGGFFILTDQSMIFLSVEQGKHRLELSREDVKSVVLEEDRYTIRIFLNHTQFIQVVSGVCIEMYDVLRENRWIAN